MTPEDCVLAVTGAATTAAPLLLIGGVLLVAGVVVMLAMSRRRRAALAAAAMGMLLVASLSVPAVPALAATGSANCEQGNDPATPQPPTDPQDPTTPPTPQPPEPEVKTPDLEATGIAPAGEFAAGSEGEIVFTMRNVGEAATSAPSLAAVALPAESGFTLSFDGTRSSATIDGDTIVVQNADVAVTGSGTAADPFNVSTDVTLAPGDTLSVGFTATAPNLETASESSATMQIESGTGGGETPDANNHATAALRAAAGETSPVCDAVNDKSTVRDTDGDGVVDACDLDSDNDGILDSEENQNRNQDFEDDDLDGNILYDPVLGDGTASYLDLDSDNDSVFDLVEGRPLTIAQFNAFDSDHNGIFDSGLSFGENGLLDDLETSPDSGVLLPELASIRSAGGNGKVDFYNEARNDVEYDLYLAGHADLDLYGGGFIPAGPDADADGIMDVVDTDTAERGSPGNAYWPY